MKLGAMFLIFVAGVATGAGALGTYWYSTHSKTDVWVANEPMKSSEGLLIPPGTEFVFQRWMPEGYAALELSINVEGSALEKFERRTEEKSFLRLPYWINEPGQ
ncbi:MAG: hypothetical protein ACN2B6_11575 [Rickettsiales bacterium]